MLVDKIYLQHLIISSSFAQVNIKEYQIDIEPIIKIKNESIFAFGITPKFQYFVTNNFSIGIRGSYVRYRSESSNIGGESIPGITTNFLSIGPLARYNIFYNKWSFYAGVSYIYYHKSYKNNSPKSFLDKPSSESGLLSPHIGVNYRFSNWGIFSQVDHKTHLYINNDYKLRPYFEFSIGVFFKF